MEKEAEILKELSELKSVMVKLGDMYKNVSVLSEGKNFLKNGLEFYEDGYIINDAVDFWRVKVYKAIQHLEEANLVSDMLNKVFKRDNEF